VAGLLLAVTASFSWILASPVGSSPDDDFHLTSVWCASSVSDELCTIPEGSADARVRTVPEALPGIACFAHDPLASAECQGVDFSWNTAEVVETRRSNVNGGYPPVYYATMGLIAGDDIQASALAMRALTVTLFLTLASALWMLLPLHRRVVLVWSWLLTCVPLGLFFLASNNPSSWALVGVSMSWLALLGYVEEADPRRASGLGIVFVVSALMAAGSRGDAALFVGVGAVVAAVLTCRRQDGRFWPASAWLRRAILPVIVSVACLYFFFSARQVASGLSGFTGGSVETTVNGDGQPLTAALEGPALLAYNILHLPALWGGLLTDGGVGWLDTPMPALVALGVWLPVIGVAFIAIARLDRRVAVSIAFVGVLLVSLPLYVLQAGGDRVGQEVQPRYLLPLMLIFVGLMVMSRREQVLQMRLPQAVILGVALAGAHFVALHVTMRRFITGIDGAGFSLSSGAEWWWAGIPFSPDAVWLVGSAAFAGFVVWALPLLTRSR
jgi:hypothetical protein